MPWYTIVNTHRVLLRLYESVGQSGTPRRNGMQLRNAFNDNLRGSGFTTTFEGQQAIPYITDRPLQNESGYTHPRYNRAAVVGSPRWGGSK